jgi:hypothetical protein
MPTHEQICNPCGEEGASQIYSEYLKQGRDSLAHFDAHLAEYTFPNFKMERFEGRALFGAITAYTDRT